MLWSNAIQNSAYYALIIVLHKAAIKLHKFTISFSYPIYLHYKIMIISIFSSLAHHQKLIYVYMYQHFEFLLLYLQL